MKYPGSLGMSEWCLWAGSALLFLGPHPTAQGDGKVRNQVSLPLSSGDRDAIVDIAKRIDPLAGAAIEGAIATGAVEVARLSDAADNVAVHDKGTILLNTTWWPKGVLAAALLHEWRHIQRIPPDAPPDTQDGSEDPDHCDDCAHARNHARTEDEILCAVQNGDLPLEEACKALDGSSVTGRKLWARCRHSSCSTPGVAYTGEGYTALGNKPRPDCPP